jgi:hypothetical protein
VRICEIKGCGGRHHAKGLCKSHYGQQHKGNDMSTPKKPAKLVPLSKKALAEAEAEYRAKEAQAQLDTKRAQAELEAEAEPGVITVVLDGTISVEVSNWAGHTPVTFSIREAS